MSFPNTMDISENGVNENVTSTVLGLNPPEFFWALKYSKRSNNTWIMEENCIYLQFQPKNLVNL